MKYWLPWIPEMQANFNQAQARYDLADQALNRFKDLKSKGFISNQELDRANSEFLIAKAQVDLYSVKLEQTISVLHLMDIFKIGF